MLFKKVVSNPDKVVQQLSSYPNQSNTLPYISYIFFKKHATSVFLCLGNYIASVYTLIFWQIQVKSKADTKGKISVVLLLWRYGRNSIPGASTTISLHLGASRPRSNTNSIQMRCVRMTAFLMN